MPNIRINRLNLTLRGLTQEQAQQHTRHIGRAILDHLKNIPEFWQTPGQTRHIDHLQVGTLALKTGPEAASWAVQSAQHISQGVRKHVQPETSPGIKRGEN